MIKRLLSALIDLLFVLPPIVLRRAKIKSDLQSALPASFQLYATPILSRALKAKVRKVAFDVRIPGR